MEEDSKLSSELIVCLISNQINCAAGTNVYFMVFV
jgi:hypothetical protein